MSAQVLSLVAARARADRIASIVEELRRWEPDARAGVVRTYLREGWATDGEMQAAQNVLNRKEQ